MKLVEGALPGSFLVGEGQVLKGGPLRFAGVGLHGKDNCAAPPLLVLAPGVPGGGVPVCVDEVVQQIAGCGEDMDGQTVRESENVFSDRKSVV